MSTSEIRSKLHQYIDRLDESFLRVVHSMIDTYVRQEEEKIAGYDLDGTPRSAKELSDLLDKEVDKGLQGGSKSVSKLEKESSQWGRSTK